MKWEIAPVVLACGAVFGACGSDGDRPGVLEGPAESRGGSGGRVAGSPPDASIGTTDAADAAPPNNCEDITCEGEGTECSPGQDGHGAACVCKEGYIAKRSEGNLTCEVDKNCVKMRSLEGGCRVQLRAAPVVGLFFGVDYCAGTAVLPEDLGDLDDAFEILVDDEPLQSESRAKVIERDVESFVMIALDASSSILDDPDLLEEVTGELQTFLDRLKSPSGEPPVTVGLYVFARVAKLMVPFTTDLEKIRTALRNLQQDPRTTLEPILGANLDGTVLMDAIQKGIGETERILDFRRVVTDNGVLTSGTLVVITDGGDSNNAAVPAAVDKTLINLISLGISNQVKGETLAKIGRDGAFLAATTKARTDAFRSIAKRVEEHPDRTYLLAYCSGTNTGEHKVTVSVNGKETQTQAGCSFDGKVLGNDVCDISVFEAGCEGRECGSMYACGACASGECCAAGRCKNPAADTNCNALDELCEPGEVCVEIEDKGYECRDPVSEGSTCGTDARCRDGVDVCVRSASGESMCVAAELNLGDACADSEGRPLAAHYCKTLNCRRENSRQQFFCVEPARVPEGCNNADSRAICERGAYCDTTCKVRGPSGLFSCNTDKECASGYCNPSTKLCDDVGACHYSWSDKLNH